VAFCKAPQCSYYALTSAHIIRSAFCANPKLVTLPFVHLPDGTSVQIGAHSPTVGQANSDIISSQAGNPFFPFIDVAVVKLAVGKNITCR